MRVSLTGMGSAAIVASLLLVVVPPACGRAGQQRSGSDVDDPLKPWTIKYHVNGGIVASDSRLTLSDDATVVAEHTPEVMRSAFRASGRQMTEVEALLRKLQLSGVPGRPPHACGGEVSISLDITYGGETYPIDVCDAKVGSSPARLHELLEAMLNDGLEQARKAEHAAAG